MNLPVIYREAQERDRPFIVDSFRKALHYQFPYKYIASDVFTKEQSPRIISLLNTSSQLIACSSDDSGLIYGFLCYELPDIIHYTLVKYNFYGFGIAKGMIAQMFPQFGRDTITITHLPNKQRKDLKIENYLTDNKLIYNPYKGE